MASNFPTGLDDLIGNQNYVDGTTIIEAAALNNLQDAIDALQEKVGIDSSAAPASHDYKLAHVINPDGSIVYTSTGVGFKDENDMASDSAVATASQQSIKAYVDATVPTTGFFTWDGSTVVSINAPTGSSTWDEAGLDYSGVYAGRMLCLLRVSVETTTEVQIRASDDTTNYKLGGVAGYRITGGEYCMMVCSTGTDGKMDVKTTGGGASYTVTTTLLGYIK